MHKHPHPPPPYRAAAVAVAAATAAALLALAHHPVGRHVPAAGAGLAHLAALRTQAAAVHGALILLYAILAGAHALFATVLGATRPAVLVAMAAYAAGCCLLAGAMLLDGFVTPQLAQRYLGAAEMQASQVLVTLAAIGVGIQVLSKAGLLAISLALCGFAWALVAATARIRGARALAGLALLAGAPTLGATLFGGLWLGPSNLPALFALQALWHGGLAWALFTQKSAGPPSDSRRNGETQAVRLSS